MHINYFKGLDNVLQMNHNEAFQYKKVEDLPTEDEVFGTIEDDYKTRIEYALELQFGMLSDVLPEEFEDGVNTLYIAGGAIYSLFNAQTPKDYDFFGTDMRYLMSLRGYFGQFVEYTSKNIQRGTWSGYTIVMTPNALTIGDWQIITNWVGEPKEVIGQFDFKHTMNWYDEELHLPYGTEYLTTTMLWYNDLRARDFVGTLLRIPDFVSRGHYIRKSEMAKILLKLQEEGFSEKDIDTMETLLDY